MKRILLFLTAMFCVTTISAQQIEETKATIISEDFVKKHVNYPLTVKFGRDVVWKPSQYNKQRATLLRKFTAKNDFGVPSEYVYKIDLIYNGGDWTELGNWTCYKLILEDTATGEQTIYDNSSSIKKNELKPRQNTFLFGKEQCKVVEQNPGAFIRIVTPRRFTTNELKTAALQRTDTKQIIYICLEGQTARGQEYAQVAGNYLSYNLDKPKAEMLFLK